MPCGQLDEELEGEPETQAASDQSTRSASGTINDH